MFKASHLIWIFSLSRHQISETNFNTVYILICVHATALSILALIHYMYMLSSLAVPHLPLHFICTSYWGDPLKSQSVCTVTLSHNKSAIICWLSFRCLQLHLLLSPVVVLHQDNI